METSKNITDEQGYSLLELILAMAVGSIVLMGAYASFSVVSKQYAEVSSISQVHSSGVPTLNMITRDLRMAGRRAVDNNIESVYNRIVTPVAITDSGNACCDQLSVEYDKGLAERLRVTYFVQERITNGDTRNALYIDISTWDGAAWGVTTNDALVVDYVEDFQVVGSDLVGGFPSVVDVLLILRSKTSQLEVTAYAKPTYEIGNYELTANDTFYRDEFAATVNIRNVRF